MRTRRHTAQRRAAACGVLAAASAALSGCGATQSSVAATATPAGVTIRNFTFTPASLTVGKGTTVTFTNGDGATHTVTADGGAFDSGNLVQGARFTHTFSSAGRFSYHCAIHQYMTGTVTVTG